MTTAPVLAGTLEGQAFLRGMAAGQLTRLAAAAALTSVPAGHRFFSAGGVARQFWLIRTGRVALDMNVPGRRRIIVEVLGRGDVVGLSWFLPPFEWQFGAVAMQPTEAFEFDAAAVRRSCEEDPALGYELSRRLVGAAAGRLHATRAKVIDLSTQLARA